MLSVEYGKIRILRHSENCQSALCPALQNIQPGLNYLCENKQPHLISKFVILISG